jgi:NhaA family Na+:H+ antiporter
MAGLHRPDGVSWRDIIVVGCVAGIGFTVALLFATAAFEPGAQLDRLSQNGSALSFGAARVTLGAARLLRVGRFGAQIV